MRTWNDLLHAYARIPLWCLGFDKHPRRLFVSADVDPTVSGFVPILMEEAYKMGSPDVDILYADPRARRARFLYAPEETKLNIPPYLVQRVHSLQGAVDEHRPWAKEDGAILSLLSMSEIGVLDDVDPKYPSGLKAALSRASEPVTSLIMSGKLPWHVTSVPSEAWAKKLDIDIDHLWLLIFGVTGADQDDPRAYLHQTRSMLARRRKKLDALHIKTLRFQSASGTDLSVGLSRQAQWAGGDKKVGDGPKFIANWPTYEVFTAPDWRTVHGNVNITMPTVVGGTVIRELGIVFANGEIVRVHGASHDVEAYQGLIRQDTGAKRAGEVALVGLDSPTARLGRIMYQPMLDENARCHIATGRAYKFCLRDSDTIATEDLDGIGFNSSSTHHDIMISDATTRVTAITYDGAVVVLLENGYWTEQFA